MDISDSLPTNNTELDDTMGNILSASNENESQNAENDPSANITTEESSLPSQNIEVNELQKTTESENIPDTTINNEESFTDTLIEQDINLIMDSEEVISSSVKDNLEVPSTSHIQEHEELWLGDNTRQLVKVDTDEDFEVIVKSLETAIVETERYDIDTVDEPVLSSVASSSDNSLGISIIETGGEHSLEDIPSNLLTSTVPLPIPGLPELNAGEPIQIVGQILSSPIDSPVSLLEHRNLDTYDEFAAISEPKVESYDEQTSSLFEVMEPEIEPIENEPSLLELQEATMPTDIPEDYQQDTAIFSNSSAAVQNITKIDDLDEICEASVDSVDEGSLEGVLESLKNVQEDDEKIEESEIQSKNEASQENIMDMRSQIADFFRINTETSNMDENIVTSTQLETKTTNEEAEDALVPELPVELESISKIEEEIEASTSSSVNIEDQLPYKLDLDVKTDTELSNKQEIEAKIDIQEEIVIELQMNKEASSEISEKQECEDIIVANKDEEAIIQESSTDISVEQECEDIIKPNKNEKIIIHQESVEELKIDTESSSEISVKQECEDIKKVNVNEETNIQEESVQELKTDTKSSSDMSVKQECEDIIKVNVSEETNTEEESVQELKTDTKSSSEISVQQECEDIIKVNVNEETNIQEESIPELKVDTESSSEISVKQECEDIIKVNVNEETNIQEESIQELKIDTESSSEISVNQECEDIIKVNVNEETNIQEESVQELKTDKDSSSEIYSKQEYEEKIDANKNDESIMEHNVDKESISVILEKEECEDNQQENIVLELKIEDESSPEVTEKQESSQNERILTDIVEEQEKKSEMDESKLIEIKNTSPEPDTDNPVETIDTKTTVEVDNKPETSETFETTIQTTESKIDESLSPKEILPSKITQKESLPSNETQKNTITSSSKPLKHSLEFDDKEQSPPKKIKLVREKFQKKSVHTEIQQLPKSIETSIEKIIIHEEIVSCSTEKEITQEINEEIDKSAVQEKKTVVEGKETIQQILEKLEDPVDKNASETKSPVKAQKLKLQRNYKLPQKSIKEKFTTKVEESVNTSTDKVVLEVEKSAKSSKKEVLQRSLDEAKDNALEINVSVVSIAINEPVIIKDDEGEPKDKIDTESSKLDSPLATICTTVISESNEVKTMDDVSEIVPEISSSTQLEISESVDNENVETRSTASKLSLEEIEETNTADISRNVEDFTEEKRESEGKAEQQPDLIETSVTIATESSELKIDESSLIKDEDLIDRTDADVEQTTNIVNETSKINQQPDLVQSEVEEKTEESCTIENELLDNQTTSNEEESEDSNKDSSEEETTQALCIVVTDFLPLEQEISDTEALNYNENITSSTTENTETKEILEKVDDKNIEIQLNIEESSEEIQEPEILEENEQISSSNADNIVQNILETAMESTVKETENIIDTTNTEQKIDTEIKIDVQKVELKVENKDDTKNVEAKLENVNIITHKPENIVETKNIVNKIEEIFKKDETDKMNRESKKDNLLTIDTQFPLLSSRLQEKFEPKKRKLTQDVKISPVTFPTISQEIVSRKLQEQLVENILSSKQEPSTSELSKAEATAFLTQNPEITLTKEIKSSTPDHSATMESATKIKITKRKLDTSEPVPKRSVTKPLSVQVDDLESSSAIIERSHSSGTTGQQENIPKIVIKPIPKPEGRASPKITIKPIKPPEEMNKSRASEESSHSPKITIKPIVKPDPLKITITKQKADDTHSILKIYQPDDNHDHHIPKLTIKPIQKTDEMQHSPRITIKPVKQSPSTSSMSPKITVKPIPSPSEQVEIIHSPKVTVKPVVNPEDSYPKVTIKPVLRPEESHKVSQLSPRQIKLKSMTFESSSGVTVEPICSGNLLPQNPEIQNPVKISVKPFAKIEETLSPKLTIKPITKTCEIVQSEDGTSNPLKLTIKPILKPEETSYQSPKITIKPIVKPDEINQQIDEDKPERIILKIQKTSLPSPKERKETKKEPEIKIEAVSHDPEKSQRLDKIKLKLTKEGSHAQIIPSISSISDGSFSLKRSLGISDTGVMEKRSKTEFPGTEILHTSDISINIVEPNSKPLSKTISEEVTIMKIDKASGSKAPPTELEISQSKFKEMLMKIQQKPDITCTPHIEAEPDYSSSSDDVKIVEIIDNDPLKDPLSINDESNSQDVMIVNEVLNTNPFQNVQIISAQSTPEPNLHTPKKRGRPRKNPLEVKPEVKEDECVEVIRPKRTCRAPPGRTPFAVKERKPRGAGRGRGGSRGRGASKSPQKSPKEAKTPRGKALKEAKALAKIEAARLAQEVVIDEITIEDSTNDTPAATPVPPIEDSPKKPEVKDIEPVPPMIEPEVKVSPIIEELPKQPPPAVYEEETRMSADNSSRAQTPARQVFTAPLAEGPEESQSSVQSTATTESSKTKKGRLEVCDPDSAVTTVDQIVEYSWANGGPYMLQEQIAQYLGVKSFKRKYPGLTRRPVEMQERDYIREKGLVSESMCDMGLTAVPSAEILDIMYSDFQEKYEEYRKCLRDKQAKEISNRQKAVSLATSQEKNKIDFKERAIRSAASWNVNFNKARKETRKCCMDLQTFTINYPAGRVKVPHKNPVGHYPLALVPGQYTDYYKSYTTNELHYLPLNTVRYGPVLPNQHCDGGQSDGSQSDSDSSSGSDSDSSDDSMSTEEEVPPQIILKSATVQLTQLINTPKSKVH